MYVTVMLQLDENQLTTAVGFDLRTVQAWIGHADMESTMRYLRPAASSEIRTKLKRVKW